MSTAAHSMIVLLSAWLSLVGLFSPPAEAQNKVWHIGYLTASRSTGPNREAFIRGLADRGYVEGKNLFLVWCFTDGKTELFPQLAADLVRRKVDLIVTSGTPATLAARNATSTIPIVMVGVADPVATGIVKSLSKPGGNITGISDLSDGLGAKNLEFLLAIVGDIRHVAVLFDPSDPITWIILKDVEKGAMKMGVSLTQFHADSLQGIEGAFQRMPERGVRAVFTVGGNVLSRYRKEIAALAIKYKLPSVSLHSPNVPAGFLLGYTSVGTSNSYRVGYYVDRIFRGAKPQDLPVEQPIKFELALNLLTAKALGLSIPPAVLSRADRVID